jgi:hypothetical protein
MRRGDQSSVDVGRTPHCVLEQEAQSTRKVVLDL